MESTAVRVFRRNASDFDAAAREITSSFYQEMPGYFSPPEILEGVFKQIFKYIAKSSQPRPRRALRFAWPNLI